MFVHIALDYFIMISVAGNFIVHRNDYQCIHQTFFVHIHITIVILFPIWRKNMSCQLKECQKNSTEYYSRGVKTNEIRRMSTSKWCTVVIQLGFALAEHCTYVQNPWTSNTWTDQTRINLTLIHRLKTRLCTVTCVDHNRFFQLVMYTTTVSSNSEYCIKSVKKEMSRWEEGNV